MNGSDKDIGNWDQRLEEQSRRGWDNYSKRRLLLDQARELIPWRVVGEFIFVDDASSASAYAQVRLNQEKNSPLDLEDRVLIKTVFKEMYITNTAQAGEWLDIITGINFEYYKQMISAEVQQVLNLTHANPDTDVAAAAHVCISALIKADVKNTQTAWIDFGTAAIQNDCFPLDAGEWNRVTIPNTDRIHANFEVGGEKVFIEYEV